MTSNPQEHNGNITISKLIHMTCAKVLPISTEST
jgi:hypothetical protein